MPLLLLSLLTLAAWLFLWLGWAGFWRVDRDPVPPEPEHWPAVTAIIPARDEAPVIAETLRSLWAQEYPGGVRIVVVDDHSSDGTADEALRTARQLGREAELQVIAAEPLPAGWTGKVWAMQQGLTDGLLREYVLFSDADISHGAGTLRELVARGEAGPCDLVSFMVRLRCQSPAERLMIPAFVFFFKLLYPFRRVNDPRDPLGGAAGGTMLVRRDALERIGGMTRIRGEVIDDCALGRELKAGGHRIWLGLSDTSESTRGYGSLGEVLGMIARTAYTQLGYSPIALAGCVVGLGLTFLAPPLLAVFGREWAQVVGGLAWVVMAAIYVPMVRFYRQSPLWAPLLPVTATLYLWATVLSAWRHYRGKGGWWKGRSQTPLARNSECGMGNGETPNTEP